MARITMLVKMIWLLILCQVVAANEDNFSSAYFVTRENRRLAGHLVKKIESTSFMACSHICLRHSLCASTNFKHSVGQDDKGTCELNKHEFAPINDDAKLVHQPGYFFTMMLKGCLMTGCLNWGCCLFDKKNETFTCSCNLPWIGDKCEVKRDVNECEAKTHNCSAIAICNNTKGSYNCTCKPGYAGDGFNCTDVNECEARTHNCSANAICNNTNGSYNCTCKPGYAGDGFNCRACQAVGVADRNVIPDINMTASTYYGSNSHPYYGRLNGTRGWEAWGPKTEFDRTDYLQVDMGAARFVCAVETQGGGPHGTNDYVKSFKLQFSSDGATWKSYKEHNTVKVFNGNKDRNGIVHNPFSTDVQARYVRFYPVTHNGWPSLRVEIYVRK